MSRHAAHYPTFTEQPSRIAGQVLEKSRHRSVRTDAQPPEPGLKPGQETPLAVTAERGASQPTDQLQDSGSGLIHQLQGQRALIETWWGQLAESTRQHLLRLTPEDFLPADVALDLQMDGVMVIAVGTVAGEDGYDALYEQPDALLAWLEQQQHDG